jgi:hypothetical protein
LLADAEREAHKTLERCSAEKEAAEREVILLVAAEEEMRLRFQRSPQSRCKVESSIKSGPVSKFLSIDAERTRAADYRR